MVSIIRIPLEIKGAVTQSLRNIRARVGWCNWLILESALIDESILWLLPLFYSLTCLLITFSVVRLHWACLSGLRNSSGKIKQVCCSRLASLTIQTPLLADRCSLTRRKKKKMPNQTVPDMRRWKKMNNFQTGEHQTAEVDFKDTDIFPMSAKDFFQQFCTRGCFSSEGQILTMVCPFCSTMINNYLNFCPWPFSPPEIDQCLLSIFVYPHYYLIFGLS